MKKVMWWLPRVGLIALNLFLALFALDVFNEPNWPVALVMHLIPNFILGLITVVFWRNGKMGGIVLLILGGIAAWFFHSLILTVPLVLIGALFIATK